MLAKIPDAADLPAFTAKVRRMDSAQRLALGERLHARAQRAQHPAKARIEARLRIVAAIELADRAQVRRRGRGAATGATPLV